MKAVFLCGGTGKRMFPIAEDKLLLDFLGRPLLEHQIKIAREAGLSHFVIIGNPGNITKIEQISKKLMKTNSPKVPLNQKNSRLWT